MALANVSLTDTFDTWRSRTNQLVVINNNLTEGGHITSGTITSTNTGTAINVSVGVIRVQGNNFTSNQLSLTSNSSAIKITNQNNGRLGSSVYFDMNVATTTSDTATNNVAAASVANALNELAIAAFNSSNISFRSANTAANSANVYTVTVGSASNTWANAVGVAGNSYTVQIGAASNTWANAVGGAGNNYSIQIGAASNTWANSIGVAGNSYTVQVGAASNNWSNTKLSNTTTTLNGILTANSYNDTKGDLRDLPLNSQSSNYYLSITDAGKLISTTANVYVPNNVFSASQAISVYNKSAVTINIIANNSVTFALAGFSNNANKLLTQNGIATIVCVAANTFVISGAGLS